jgi:hypothetical protein
MKIWKMSGMIFQHRKIICSMKKNIDKQFGIKP